VRVQLALEALGGAALGVGARDEAPDVEAHGEVLGVEARGEAPDAEARDEARVLFLARVLVLALRCRVEVRGLALPSTHDLGDRLGNRPARILEVGALRVADRDCASRPCTSTRVRRLQLWSGQRWGLVAGMQEAPRFAEPKAHGGRNEPGRFCFFRRIHRSSHPELGEYQDHRCSGNNQPADAARIRSCIHRQVVVEDCMDPDQGSCLQV